MNLDYFPRALVIALASFFFAQVFCHAIAGWAGARLAELARRQPARQAARRLWLYRMLPSGGGLVLWAWFCLPGYLGWEPRIREHTGFIALLAAMAGMVWVLFPLARAGRAMWRTEMLLRKARRCGRMVRVEKEAAPALEIQSQYPLLALAGSWRPRVLIAKVVREGLSQAELRAALRHEAAHRAARDNLKRLGMLLLPPAWPGGRGARALEREWARQTEWAADDEAAGADGSERLPLAAALLELARLQQTAKREKSGSGGGGEICFSLTGAGIRLSERVDRLLAGPAAAPATPERRPPAGMAIGLAGLGVVLAYLPLLHGVHLLLEALVR